MSYQYTGPQGQAYARGWGDDFTDQEKRNLQIGQYAPGQAGAIAREEAQDRINNPHLWAGGAPGPLPPLPDNNAKGWLQDLLFRSTGDAGGNTLAQDLVGGNIGAGSSPASLGFLKEVGKKLGNFLNVAPGNPGQPRDMQGTELIPDSQNPGKYIHPGAQQIRDRNERIRLGF